MIYLVSVITSMVSCFSKGWQHKNVIGKRMVNIAITSYIMALLDIATVSFVIKYGWGIAISSGTGAAIGMCLSVYLHDKVYGAKP